MVIKLKRRYRQIRSSGIPPYPPRSLPTAKLISCVPAGCINFKLSSDRAASRRSRHVNKNVCAHETGDAISALIGNFNYLDGSVFEIVMSFCLSGLMVVFIQKFIYINMFWFVVV